MNKLLNGLGKIPTAAFAAPLFGAVAALFIMFMPQWIFERAIVATGLPALLPLARPPLGQTARILAAIFSAMLVSGLLWTVLSQISKLVKANRPKARGSRIEPVSSSATGHRRPIFAERDLGAPFMSDEAIAIAKDELVADPIVAAEALAMPSPLREEAEAPTVVVAAPTEEPTLVPVPPVAFADDDSIAGLMNRLENALERRQTSGGGDSQLPGNISSLRQAMGMETPRTAIAR
jgi:hypothetical protein